MDQEIPDRLIQTADAADSRFRCQKEPNSLWTVWDRFTNRPARLGGPELVGCTSYRASAAAEVLTQIYSNGLDADAHLPRPVQGRETPKALEDSTPRDAEEEK